MGVAIVVSGTALGRRREQEQVRVAATGFAA